MKQEPSEERKAPFSHMVARGSWRSLRVLAGDELSLRAKEGPFPLVRFPRSLKSRGKVPTLGKVSGKVRLSANIYGLFYQGLWHPPGHRNEVKPHTPKPGISSSGWGFLWVETHFQIVENSPEFLKYSSYFEEQQLYEASSCRFDTTLVRSIKGKLVPLWSREKSDAAILRCPKNKGISPDSPLNHLAKGPSLVWRQDPFRPC